VNRGLPLLQSVGERIVACWLRSQGHLDVVRTAGRQGLAGKAVDITYAWHGGINRIKVKADPYIGTDRAKVDDRALTFYRADERSYAFEAVANVATREPGWMVDSEADEIYYYFLALDHPEDEVRALSAESDGVLLGELRVDRDELVVMPMQQTRTWFEANADAYTPRPVLFGGGSGWYRLVPRSDLEPAVAGIRSVGPIFASLAR
jgi:hypothetical protein